MCRTVKQKGLIHKLNRSFADTHKSYIYSALNALDLTKPQVEGVVDFGHTEFEKAAELVRTPGKIDNLLDVVPKDGEPID